MKKKILNHFREYDKKILQVIQKVDYENWFQLKKDIDHFQNIFRTIIGQQLSGKAARTIYDRVVAALPDKKVSPKSVLSTDENDLRNAGMSWAKVRSVRDLSQKVSGGQVLLDKLDVLSNKEVIAQLVSVKGIGLWTAQMYLMFTLGKEDIFSHGDAGLRKGIGIIYQIENPTEDQIENIIAPWSPYKTYGAIALWYAVDNQ